MKFLKSQYLIIFILLQACNSSTNLNKLYLPDSLQLEIKKTKRDSCLIIYYHSGDCSLCFSVLKSLSTYFPEVPLISITPQKDVLLVDYYLKEIGFVGISFVDSISFFLIRNKDLLYEHNLFLIDKNFNILVEGENLENNLKKNIDKVLSRNSSQ